MNNNDDNNVVDPKKPKKSPLDILEELLNEVDDSPGSKTKPSESKPKADGSGSDLSTLDQEDQKPPSGPSPEELEAQKKLEEEKLNLERLKHEAEAKDQDLIDQQRSAIKSLDMEETQQIRLNQDEEKKQNQVKNKTDQEGYEVVQLGHKKIYE
jgi:hypothetical protein